MAGMGNYLKNQLRTHLFRTGSFTKPAAIYISLHTADPGGTGASEFASTGAYARVQNGPGDASWTAEATDGLTANAGTITFPAPTGDWGQATHAGAWDAATGGNFLGRATLTSPKTINNGDPAPSFAAGALQFSWT